MRRCTGAHWRAPPSAQWRSWLRTLSRSRAGPQARASPRWGVEEPDEAARWMVLDSRAERDGVSVGSSTCLLGTAWVEGLRERPAAALEVAPVARRAGADAVELLVALAVDEPGAPRYGGGEGGERELGVRPRGGITAGQEYGVTHAPAALLGALPTRRPAA